MRSPFGRVAALLACSAALLMGSLAPTPAAAQGGKNNVTFWDDAGSPGDSADIDTPATAAANNVMYLNPNGGRTPDSNLMVIVSELGVQVIRDRDWQIYDYAIESGSMGFTLYADGRCFNSGFDCTANTDPTLGTTVSWADWGSETLELVQDGPTTWKARAVEVAEWDGRTYTVTATYSYTPPSPYIGVEATVTASPEYTGTMLLYLNADMYLDGSDYGPGFSDQFDGNLIVVQTNNTGVGGIAETGRTFDSYFEGLYSCLYSDYSVQECGSTAAHWSVDETSPDHWFGPGYGKGYPVPAIINGRTEGDDINEDIDAGVGAHWDVTTNRTVKTSLIFISRDAFDAGLLGAPVTPTPPTVCQQTPDVAVTPQFINLAPGGRATVTVTMRNLCSDAPTRSSDLLFSLSDGLRVVGGSDGLVNLGQRAAMQGFSLNSGETRSWTFEVEAGAMLPTAPLFVAELYEGSNVTKRIDGVFLTPAPAVVAPTADPAPAAPAAPAPLPAALPNTSGGVLPLWLPALAAGAAGLALRRFTRR